MSTIVTGAAGFIGMHLCERLLAAGHRVVGIDSMNAYYDPALKAARLERLSRIADFRFEQGDLADRAWTAGVFARARASKVVHLAAQAGVRYSLANPSAYIDSNVVAFGNVLEACRAGGVSHLVYASSSSVYGANQKVPFSTSDRADEPVSLYAATKRSNELMAHVYGHLFKLPITGLRFFTVYGPWGRPDMAYYSFTKAILAGEKIPVFNNGDLARDFTFIDDIVEGVARLVEQAPDAGARLFNIGASSPVRLLDFIKALESAIGRRAILDLKPMQPGDVPATFADVSDLEREIDFRPSTPLDAGLRRFVDWYQDYHAVAR